MPSEDYAAAGLSGEQVMDFAAKIGVWPSQARDLLAAAAPLIAARATKPYRDRIEALEQLLACYRIGKPPSEALHRRLEQTRAALATTEEDHHA